MKRKHPTSKLTRPRGSANFDLQKHFDVQIITQNVDDLHERAGSKKVLHLHGEIRKMRSSIDEELIYPIKKKEIKLLVL